MIPAPVARPQRGRWFLLASILASPPLHAGDPPLPFPVQIQVVEGSRSLPGAIRNDVEDALLVSLRARHCAPGASVRPPEGRAEDGVLLRLVLDDAVEENRWDVSVADRARPVSGADPMHRSTSVLEMAVRMELLPQPGGKAIRDRSYRVVARRTAATPGEDSAALARAEAVRRVAREAADMLCKGSRRKLLRQLERSLPSRDSRPAR